MDSPCSVTRRQAWAQCSRQWLTVEDTELQTSDTQNSLAPQPQHESYKNNNLQSSKKECSTGKIETWLKGCGHGVVQDKQAQPAVESFPKAGNSFEDDLSLGAEALARSDEIQHKEFGQCPLLQPPPKSRKHFHASNTSQQKLPLRNMGQSMASSVLSSQSKTLSSVTEVLQMCADDAEETLYQLGFGCEEPQVTARIPARFFNFPSNLRGINFRLFLESQLQRIREEDPSLSLASRFRQVEVLTAMANAFYSLYSHVSRTPVQKLAPPEFSFLSPTAERSIGQRFFSTVRNEPRSPVERLKDTVSKMCLYSGTRGSESGSPSCSPRKRNSLPDVVNVLMENVREEGSQDHIGGKSIQDQEEAQRIKDVVVPMLTEMKPSEKVSEHERISNAHRKRIQRWSQSGQRESLRAKTGLFRFEQVSVESKSHIDGDKEISDSLMHSILKDSNGAKTYDALAPQGEEFATQVPCRLPQMDSVASLDTPTATQIHQEFSLRTFAWNQEMQPQICLLPGSLTTDEFSADLPLNSQTSQNDLVTQQSTCQITVTGWEDDVPVFYKDSTEEPSQPMYSEKTASMLPSSSVNQKFLSPVKSSSQINDVPKQANSFELEEVQSVGEEENISAEYSRAYTLSVTASTHQTSCPLRGDSFQSDSSGYAEEDIQHPYTTTQKEIS